MNHLADPPDLAAVIFDMDGLMLDTERIYHAIWRTTGAELGYDFSSQLLHATTGRTFADCYALIQAAFGPTFPLAAFQARWPQHWEQHVTQHGIPQKPGLIELLDLLDAHAIPKAVATSTSHAEAHATLLAGGIRARFSTVVTGDLIQHGKPAPDIYLLAAQRLGVAPQACVALEDSEAGVLAAAAAGMYTMMIPDTKEPGPAALARAHQIFPTLHAARRLIHERWLGAAYHAA